MRGKMFRNFSLLSSLSRSTSLFGGKNGVLFPGIYQASISTAKECTYADKTSEVLGMTYKTTNVLGQVGHNLYHIPKHPVNIIKQRIVHHFHKTYTTKTGICYDEDSTEHYIELSDATPRNSKCLAEGNNSENCSVFVVKMCGLPYKATQADIVDFFAGTAPIFHGEDGIFIPYHSNGHGSGIAFALFATQADQSKALKFNNFIMPWGVRYVELITSSINEFKLVLSRFGLPQQQHHFSSLLELTLTAVPELNCLNGHERKCVRLRGIPHSCTIEDVLQFLGSFKDDIVTNGVYLMVNATNYRYGDCYVQMTCSKAAKKACDQLHKKCIGSRYINLLQCSGDEAYQAMQGRKMGGPK